MLWVICFGMIVLVLGVSLRVVGSLVIWWFYL